MSATRKAYEGAAVFDGRDLLTDRVLLVDDGAVAGIAGPQDVPNGYERIHLDGGILAPGFVDLQVNGGGGIMFNADPGAETLATIAAAHAVLGSTTIFPTLITDTPEKSRAAVEAVVTAIRQGVPGIAGLHLEGPHLSLTRKGAHDPALIRPMRESDLKFLLEAARQLPALMVTLAPENATLDQIRALAAAGVVVSLGHSDADFDTCRRYAMAGARCATHLFNAMSQLHNRAPGLVGAVLQTGEMSAGLIADGIHVAPDAIDIALRAKRGPGSIFLVTDSMAPAGTELSEFSLNGRRISRSDGRLTLADGTLAGADLDMCTALRLLTRRIGLATEQALEMATSRPAALMGLEPRLGRLLPGSRADFVHLSHELALMAVWQGGEPVTHRD